jgi:hypothetical protein
MCKWSEDNSEKKQATLTLVLDWTEEKDKKGDLEKTSN